MRLTVIYATGRNYTGEWGSWHPARTSPCIIPGHRPKLSENELLPHKWCIISQSYHLAALLGFLLCAVKANKGRSSSASQRVVGRNRT